MRHTSYNAASRACNGLRRSVIATLLICLMGTLSACSTTPIHEPVKLTPDDAWLQPVHVDLGPMRTYGDVLYTALPRALEAVRECNQDKAAIKTWKTDRSAHN